MCAGVQSDAHKVAEFRALMRMRRTMLSRADEYPMRNFTRMLIKVHFCFVPAKFKTMVQGMHAFFLPAHKWLRLVSVPSAALCGKRLEVSIVQHRLPSPRIF